MEFKSTQVTQCVLLMNWQLFVCLTCLQESELCLSVNKHLITILIFQFSTGQYLRVSVFFIFFYCVSVTFCLLPRETSLPGAEIVPADSLKGSHGDE